MTDPFVDLETDAQGTDSMSRAVEPSTNSPGGAVSGNERSHPASQPLTPAPATSSMNGGGPIPHPIPSTGLVRESLAGKHVCPFCGQHNSNSNEPCPRCTMEDTAATRQATK